MVKRSKQQQSKHQEKVKQIADKLKHAGWKVEADLSGYDRPEPIGKKDRIPDVVAEKSGATRIIEVETEGSIEKDKDQQATFRQSAAHRKRTTFTIEEV